MLSEGENIYNQRGTVLHRVLSKKSYEKELIGDVGIAPLANQLKPSPPLQSQPALASPDVRSATGPARSSTTKSTTHSSSVQNTIFDAAAAPAAGEQHRSSSPSQVPQTGVEDIGAVTQALEHLFPSVAVASDAYSGVLRRSGVRTLRTCEGAESRATAANELPRSGDDLLPLVRVAALDHTSRVDIIQLLAHLQQRCADEHALPRGVLCPTREAIFNDGMRELTRQVTVLCPERGLLLHELSNTMSSSTGTYDALFEGACQYAARKSTERDLRNYLFEEEKNMQRTVRALENKVNELRAKYAGMQQRSAEQHAADTALRAEEVAYIKKSNQQLVNEIKRLAALEAAPN